MEAFSSNINALNRTWVNLSTEPFFCVFNLPIWILDKFTIVFSTFFQRFYMKKGLKRGYG